MEKLSGDYIAGFVDGEGCFALKYRRDVRYERTNQPEYFYWALEFAILLKGDDGEILKRICETLECGKVLKPDKRGLVRFSVTNIKDLSEKIVPFFEAHPLNAKKAADFNIWKEAVKIFKQRKDSGKSGKAWEENDLLELGRLREKMKQYKGGNRGNWKWLK